MTNEDLAPTMCGPNPMAGTSARANIPNGQSGLEIQISGAVGEQDIPQAMTVSLPKSVTPAGSEPADHHRVDGDPRAFVVGSDLPARQSALEDRTDHAGRDQITNGQVDNDPQKGRAVGIYLPARPTGVDAPGTSAGGDQDPATTTAASSPIEGASLPSDPAAPAIHGSESKVRTPGLADPTLALLADVLDDLEKTRIANENRLRQLTRTDADKDGETRGFGLDESHPAVARLAGIVAGIAKLEHDATLNLQREMRAHPLGPWVKATKGVGEKQGARLLAAIGNPYIRPEIVREDGTIEPFRPRTVSELWAFCGYKPGQRRRKGERANWSSIAKARAFLIAEAMLKAGNRDLYDARKDATRGRLHAVECPPCGPKGRPAPAGSPLSDRHRHVDALRIVAKKAVLLGLWREARRLHKLGSGHVARDTPLVSAAADRPDENN